MTVAATPLVAENTIAPVSAVHACSPVPVRPPRPYVDDGLAVDVDRQRTATEPTAWEQAGEDAHDVSEARVGCALHVARQAFPGSQE